MPPFTPHSDLIRAREPLEHDVDAALEALGQGILPGVAEREHVDFKEEAGRRGVGGVLLAGKAHNLAAADQLAREVACMANTPGGGALIVGVEDSTGALLGASMDPEWLKQRVYQRVDVAPAVAERYVVGARLLVVLVAEAREPVEDQDGKLRWRTGGTCQPVDRAEWWLHRQNAAGTDPMAAVTERTVADVPDGAVVAARRFLGEGRADDDTPRSTSDLLTWLGVLRPDGHLTQAGALVFCRSDRSHLSLTVVDVEGGDVLAAAADMSGASLIEQIATVEARLDTLNTAVTITGGFAEEPVRRLPARAVREAVLNAVVHRDWMPSEPVTIVWVDADSALQVVSDGGFVGGITEENVLTARYARSPALADLFRALRLVDKGGMGVDRMVREMVVLGHRRPTLVEEPGPRVRTRLVGGRPVVPVMNLVARIQPAVRSRDVRVALIVHTLLHEPFVTPSLLTSVLQRPEHEVVEALEGAAECRIDGQPLLRSYKDAWMLSTTALEVVGSAPERAALRGRGVLTYRRPESPGTVARRWLSVHQQITSGDQAAMTGLTAAGALRQLERLVTDGVLRRGDGSGRNAHFTAATG